ncbi:MAG: phosphate/phosphite/phosphonate ABC transporter substrate-binding protein [Rhodobacteraceae bacterium]|nr:phosphate/phosphite/phosphonate ABC transporter substrate-binding protein [Paracoccaceae bacterium]
MIASLPMYDRPETAGANDRLWTGISRALASRGIDAPAALDRTADLWETWTSPDLVLSQTCGLPYRTRLHGQVNLVASPVCDLPDVPPGHYHSVLVARRTDPRLNLADFDGATLAYNEALSQSGWAAPAAAAADIGIVFGAGLATGAHRNSARAVAEGQADLAAIDGLTWRMIRRWDPIAAELKEIGTTAPTPALPWITAAHREPAPLAEAIAEAIGGLSAEDRDALGILGAIRIAPERYLAIPNPPPPPPDRV